MRQKIADPHDIEPDTRVVVDLADDCYYEQSELTVNGSRRGPRDDSTMYGCSGPRGHHNTLVVKDGGAIRVNSPTGRHEGVAIYKV